MNLTGQSRPWDRFAHWGRPAAAAVLALVVVLMGLAAFTAPASLSGAKAPGQAPSAAASREATAAIKPEDTDLLLYRRITERVAAGEDYYRVATEEQRARGFPVRPGVAVRLPTLAYLGAILGPTGMTVLAVVLAIAVLAAWWHRLGQEPGGREHRVIAMLLLVIGAGLAFKPQYLGLHEVWAGMLLALSFGLHRPGRWGGAVIAAGLALGIREHALPFVLLMGAMALWRRDWREVLAWGALVVAFGVAMWLHLEAVAQVVSAADPLSPPWLVLRGLSGLTGNIVHASVLYRLPGWIAAPLALLPLLGWAGWRSNAGLFGFLLFAGYGVFFMIAGRANNFYWALVVIPCWFIGLTFVPRALRSLWSGATGANALTVGAPVRPSGTQEGQS